MKRIGDMRCRTHRFVDTRRGRFIHLGFGRVRRRAHTVQHLLCFPDSVLKNRVHDIVRFLKARHAFVETFNVGFGPMFDIVYLGYLSSHLPSDVRYIRHGVCQRALHATDLVDCRF